MENEQNFKDKKPFYRKHLEVDDKSRVITFRINQEEDSLIQKSRELLDVEAEGKAIKICFKVGLNVLQNTFGEKLLRYLSSTKRERKSDYEGRGKSSKVDSVIHKEGDL
jgi:hypothetical protein